MSDKFARGKKALGICERCGQTFLLTRLFYETQNRKLTNLRVCKSCKDADHPQYRLSDLKDFDDPKPLKDWRPDQYPVPDGRPDDVFYEFSADGELWQAGYTSSSVVNLGLWTIAGDDGAFPAFILREVGVGNQVALNASALNFIRIGFSREEPDDDWDLLFKWNRTTDTSGTFVAGRTVTLPDPEFYMGSVLSEVAYEIGDHASWNGTIEELRIQPQSHSDSTRPFTIDYVRFTEF